MTGSEHLDPESVIEFRDMKTCYALWLGDASILVSKGLPQADKLRITRALCDAITQMGLAVVQEGIETIQPVEQSPTFVCVDDRIAPWVDKGYPPWVERERPSYNEDSDER